MHLLYAHQAARGVSLRLTESPKLRQLLQQRRLARMAFGERQTYAPEK